MEATGIVRKVDRLGRIALPVEVRRKFDIGEKDPLELYLDGTTIILKKYVPGCIFCGDISDVICFKGKRICPLCLEEFRCQI